MPFVFFAIGVAAGDKALEATWNDVRRIGLNCTTSRQEEPQHKMS